MVGNIGEFHVIGSIVRKISQLKNSVMKRSKEDNITEEDITELANSLGVSPLEECVVIGNGPSLASTLENNIDFFKNKKLFCVNSFAESEYYEKLMPEFYVLADPNFWLQNVSEESKKPIEKTVDAIEEKTYWDLTILLPLRAKRWNCFLNLAKQKSNIKICYYPISGDNIISVKQFNLYEKNITAPIWQNVLIAATFISLNLNFKTIFLVGADMSFHEEIVVDENNVLCIAARHFYDNKEMITLRPMYSSIKNNKVTRVETFFTALATIFKGFDTMEAYAQYKKAKIYNATSKSYIDSFERYIL